MEEQSRSALVLSAGGLFGAYQAGVWQVLSEAWKPDLVVGASVGSLNGWMIASGCPPAELIERWRNLQPAHELRWRWPSGLAEGLLDCGDLDAYIRDMCANWTPAIPFGLVLTNLRTMRPDLFRAPELEWQHLAASCSVPLFLRHHQIGGCWYSDGGLIDPLPVHGAIEMGARTLITVNLLRERPLPVRAAVRALRLYSRYRAEVPAAVRVIDISPRRRLGSARDAMIWSPEHIDCWIEQGRRDAEAALPAVRLYTAGAQNNPGVECLKTPWPATASTD